MMASVSESQTDLQKENIKQSQGRPGQVSGQLQPQQDEAQGNAEGCRAKASRWVVLVPGTFALYFNLNVSTHANNFLVNNVTRARLKI